MQEQDDRGDAHGDWYVEMCTHRVVASKAVEDSTSLFGRDGIRVGQQHWYKEEPCEGVDHNHCLHPEHRRVCSIPSMKA